jgi:hypothetical protein
MEKNNKHKTRTRVNSYYCTKLLLCFLIAASAMTQNPVKKTKLLAFYTAKNDAAHISFVHEANNWLAENATANGFEYDSTNDWKRLNTKETAGYDLLLFLDTRPEEKEQREAFEQYMKNGGAWIGFHFAAFALTPSAYPQNWDWYHNEFLGSGQYKSNTWRPTAAQLHVDDTKSPITKNIPQTYLSAPNEWYRWENDLRKNPDIDILVSIDPSSFPLGTGPKPNEIWHEGYYPVVWANTKYRMVYFNMGHNDMDYEYKTNRRLSSTFQSEWQNRLLLNAIRTLTAKRSAD